jgi:hypothetical protein
MIQFVSTLPRNYSTSMILRHLSLHLICIVLTFAAHALAFAYTPPARAAPTHASTSASTPAAETATQPRPAAGANTDGNRADVTFQFINDTGRALNLKIFSRGESRQQWPALSKAFSVRPAAEVQQLRINCTVGESVCWGAWATVQSVSGEMQGTNGRATRTSTFNIGVGQRGSRDCPQCCQVCKADSAMPIVKLGGGFDPSVR